MKVWSFLELLQRLMKDVLGQHLRLHNFTDFMHGINETQFFRYNKEKLGEPFSRENTNDTLNLLEYLINISEQFQSVSLLAPSSLDSTFDEFRRSLPEKDHSVSLLSPPELDEMITSSPVSLLSPPSLIEIKTKIEQKACFFEGPIELNEDDDELNVLPNE